MLTLHLALDGDADPDGVLREATRVLADRFDITHSALQFEYARCPDEV
jgi:Co/Zn/Cd efflux system component